MWWQFASLALVSALTVGVVLALAWYFRRHFYKGSVLPLNKVKKSPKTSQQYAQENRIFQTKVPEILSTRPPAESLPGLLSDAAESCEKMIAEPLEEHEEPNPNNLAEAEASAEPAEPFLVDTNFERLRLRHQLGAGGFGRVQLVEEPDSSVAAWKAVPKAGGLRQSLLTEKRVLAATKICPSPFIVAYHGCCHTCKYVYFKQEGLVGGELAATYRNKDLRGSETHARYYMACALSGVEHLHKLRVMLRSLKPEDCALDSRGVLKLVDFGLSKFLVDKTYTQCGTPDYFSPEIVSGSGHSFSVDWWCAGVMLFELLTGDIPFVSPDAFGIYRLIMKGIENVKFPSAMSSPAKHLIRKLCHAVPEKRLPEVKGFQGLKRHSFFNKLIWEDLADAIPPWVPGDDSQANFPAEAKEEELPSSFTKPVDGDVADWSSLFGPQGPTDEFPCASSPAASSAENEPTFSEGA